MLLRSGVALWVSLALGWAAVPVFAEGVAPAEQAQVGDGMAQVVTLGDTLQIGAMIDVMQTEGVDYADTLAAEMFPGNGGAQWRAKVAMIYDPVMMRGLFDSTMAQELAGQAAVITAAQAFFGDARGQNILTLELEARRALMDEQAEAAAKAAVETMRAKGDPRFDRLADFAAANDLIEMNVMGALNANLAFYKGLAAGGGFAEDMPEDQMLTDVWSQEADIRAETDEWLFGYLSLAYATLPDADMAAYLAFSESPDGRKLNAAIFAAFDAVFSKISYDLGVAAAKQMQGEDI